MHSSRMRTVHCSRRLPCWGGVYGGSARGWLSAQRLVSAQGCLHLGKVSASVLCLPRRDVCLGGVCLEGCLPREDVCLEGCLPREVNTSPRREFLTHACENITFLQLHLRTVIIHIYVERQDR